MPMLSILSAWYFGNQIPDLQPVICPTWMCGMLYFIWFWFVCAPIHSSNTYPAICKFEFPCMEIRIMQKKRMVRILQHWFILPQTEESDPAPQAVEPWPKDGQSSVLWLVMGQLERRACLSHTQRTASLENMSQQCELKCTCKQGYN